MVVNIIQKDNIVDSLHEICDAIRNHNVDTATISLHNIIKECLQYLDDSYIDFALLVRFYAIYIRLIYLKLSSLLPSDDVEWAEEHISVLLKDIFDYKKSQELSQVLRSAYAPDSRYFIKKEKSSVYGYLKDTTPPVLTSVSSDNSDVNLQHLVQAFSKFIQISQQLALVPTVRRFSLEKMRERVLFRIKKKATTLRDMVDANEKSYHVVAAMLTILTLCTEQCVSITQHNPFDNITLQPVSSQ